MMHPVLEAALARMEANTDVQAYGGMCVIENDRRCFCALGVIADEYIKAHPGEVGWVEDKDSEEGEAVDFAFVSPGRSNYRWTSFLPEKISNALGLTGKSASIAEWNDSVRLPLPEIAQRIRDNLTLFPAGNA